MRCHARIAGVALKLRLFSSPAPLEASIPNAGLDLLATAVLVLDARRCVVFANPAAENLFELSRSKLVGHATRDLFGDAPELTAAIDKAIASGASYTEQELELGVAGKSRLHLNCTVSVIEGTDRALLLELRHIDQQLKIAREERLPRLVPRQDDLHTGDAAAVSGEDHLALTGGGAESSEILLFDLT